MIMLDLAHCKSSLNLSSSTLKQTNKQTKVYLQLTIAKIPLEIQAHPEGTSGMEYPLLWALLILLLSLKLKSWFHQMAPSLQIYSLWIILRIFKWNYWVLFLNVYNIHWDLCDL